MNKKDHFSGLFINSGVKIDKTMGISKETNTFYKRNI